MPIKALQIAGRRLRGNNKALVINRIATTPPLRRKRMPINNAGGMKHDFLNDKYIFDEAPAVTFH